MMKFGVIGYPVKHSLSPVMHNASYKTLSIDASYEAIEIEAENAREKILELFNNGYSGLNVTMPYKELAYEICIAHGAASRLHSVNTLIADQGGNLHGYCTDGDGFVLAITDEGLEPNGLKVLVLGAGGASRAICDALALKGANILVSSRNLEKTVDAVSSVAVSLKEKSGSGTIDVVEYSERNQKALECDLIVNATPVGMTRDGHDDNQIPLDITGISSSTFLYDTIYHPLQTTLLTQAKEAGCKTSNGLSMLIHQGALAFKLMTHQDPPIDVMKDSVKNFIKGDNNGN